MRCEQFTQRVKQKLASREKMQIKDRGAAISAVLIPVRQHGGEYWLLFTKRSTTVDTHKGELTFPGGRWEPGDQDLLATALREAFEEIGVQPRDVEVLGELDDEKTRSTNFIIVPFVGFVPYPYRFDIHPGEVVQLLEVPMSALRDKGNWQQEVVNRGGQTARTHFCFYNGEVIWGATARIVHNFLSVVA